MNTVSHARPAARAIDHIAEAREAHRRNDWRASYDAFARADGLVSMPTDDLEAYGVAAWRIGAANEGARITQLVYSRLVRTDPIAAAMKAAELGLGWQARGHAAVARMWAERARVLLVGASATGATGYLAYLDAVAALGREDRTALAGAVSAVDDAADATSDAALRVLGRVLDGVVALLEARDAQGYRMLDAALLPVLDERVPLEWAADVYRLVLGERARADRQHRRAWTESMRLWSANTRVVLV